MATHDYVIANGSGAAVRADLNDALSAIVTQNSNATAPTTTYAYQTWFDTSTSPATIKQRDGSNASWITIGYADGTIDLGTVGTPSIRFNGDTNTGIYSPGADQVAISTGGTQQVTVDSSGRLLVGTTSSRTIGTTAFNIQTEGASTEAGISSTRYSNNTSGPNFRFVKTRGTTAGSVTAVQSSDSLGTFGWYGTDGTNAINAAAIEAAVDGTPGTNDMPGRLVFSTTADGASTVTEHFRITSAGELVSVSVYNNTSAVAANMAINSSGRFLRATSSAKYKTDVETLGDQYADAVLNCRPVWYRSTTGNDNPNWGWWGFIAEEVAEIDPRLVFWKTEEALVQEDGSRVTVPLDQPEPEGVQYDRFVPHLLNLIKRQQQAIADLETRLAALEAN